MSAHYIWNQLFAYIPLSTATVQNKDYIICQHMTFRFVVTTGVPYCTSNSEVHILQI